MQFRKSGPPCALLALLFCGTDVCLADFAEGDEQLVLPCFHVFHTACAEQWLEKHLRCPMCREEVALPNSDTVHPGRRSRTCLLHGNVGILNIVLDSLESSS